MMLNEIVAFSVYSEEYSKIESLEKALFKGSKLKVAFQMDEFYQLKLKYDY